MKKILIKAFIVLWIVNALFIAFMLLEGSKYPLNLMTEQQTYKQLQMIKGVGEVKAERIAEQRNDIIDVRQLDTASIKYSKYFTIRSWDMRTDVMYLMLVVSLLVQMCLTSVGLIWFCSKGIVANVNKYIVLDSNDLNKKEG